MKFILKKILRIIPDKLYIKLKYLIKIKKKLNLSNPQTFNEKLQWLKLNDRRDIYITMVDKHAVKEYVAKIIGDEYIIPTLKVYEKFDDINFDELPNQFVLKCTHDSGGIVIVKDRLKFDIKKARKIINNSLKSNYYYSGREWPYKNVKPRIIVEPYLEDEKYKELRDYKFFTFSGVVKMLYVASNRQGAGETYFDFFDINYKHLKIIDGHEMNPIVPEKPKNFDLMIKLAEKLSNKLPHIRIDFYEINGKVYFGELTLYHMSGFTPFIPEKWDIELGKYLKISI